MHPAAPGLPLQPRDTIGVQWVPTLLKQQFGLSVAKPVVFISALRERKIQHRYVI